MPWWLQSSAQPILAQVVRATARPGAPPLQELIAAAFDIQCVYRPEIKQALIVLTITDTTGIIDAILTDPRTDHDSEPATSTAALGEAHAARTTGIRTKSRRSGGRRQGQAELALAVRPPGAHREAGRGQLRFDA